MPETLQRPKRPVVLDVCGGDGGPELVIKAARRAVELGVPILLAGPQAICEPTGLPWVSAEQVVPMGLKDPGLSIRKYSKSAHIVGPQLVRDGQAAGYVSAGDTGATLAGSQIKLRKFKGYRRATVPTPFPNKHGDPTIMVDSGTNLDCSPQMLAGFARLAILYAQLRYGITKPRVAQLTIGTEDDKGNALVKATRPLLIALCEELGLEFVGNVESKQLLHCQVADVVVGDGHDCNIALKGNEGGAKAVGEDVLEVIYMNDANRAAGKILMNDLLARLAIYDPNTYGGMMLLGLKGITMIVHGSATAEGIATACLKAYELYESDIIGQMEIALAAINVDEDEASSLVEEDTLQPA